MIDQPLIFRDIYLKILFRQELQINVLCSSHTQLEYQSLCQYIDTHGTSKISDDELINKITDNIDLTPRGIRDHLNLHKTYL